MGSKKRIRVKLMEGQTDLATNNTVLVPSNKKIKMDNNKEGEMGNGVMEIIKKRKQIDMEKQPKQMNISGLPEFHVSVFKDLASKDSSVRDAALEKIVTELQEVQKEYDRLKDKDNLVDDVMMMVDVRDCLLGWLFAYGAVTRSRRLAKEWLFGEDTLHIKEFMSAIIFLSGKKIYFKLLSAGYLSSIGNCLKETTYCQPRIHSWWPFLVNVLLPDTALHTEDAVLVSCSLRKRKRDRKSKEIAKSVQCFCEIVIEESLLQSSHDRKHLAFDILLLLLPRLPSSFIQIVLSYKVIKCLIDILSEKDSWLYKDGRNFLKELLVWVRNDDVRRAAVIVAFQKHSNGKFDCITKTKTKSIPSILKRLKLDPEAKFLVQKEILKFLDVQGLFSAFLGNEVTSFELKEKFRWPKATTSSALCRMTLRNIPLVFLFQTLNDDDEQAVKNLLEMEGKLYKEERNCELSSDANKLHALRYLLILLLLQVLLQPGEFSDAASELIVCCLQMLRMLWIIEKDLNPARHQQDEDELLGAEKDEDVGEAETGETAKNDGESEDSEAVVGGDVADKELPEDSDDSDEGMDDEAMFRMDTYLAEIFKPKKDKAGGETGQSQFIFPF
ncbi:hypothetical protein Gogos_012311 [Gossypium gossypioides]|uniref:Uncharacterized protein n=1 Tax=Gossypium gossypioides TaxID=34282 RepID=A0A7J9BS79_GOSGO|nr:hypothetical protein [Gossypium gossypioides]